jgi:hypothetical protein
MPGWSCRISYQTSSPDVHCICKSERVSKRRKVIRIAMTVGRLAMIVSLVPSTDTLAIYPQI